MIFKIKELYWDNIEKDYIEAENDCYIPKNKIDMISINGDFGAVVVDDISLLISKERALEIIAIMDEVKDEN